MKCKVCGREANEEKVCPLHMKAHENIVKNWMLGERLQRFPGHNTYVRFRKIH